MNMPDMMLTFEVSQPPILWLKAAAPVNIKAMFPTEEVSQPPMS